MQLNLIDNFSFKQSYKKTIRSNETLAKEINTKAFKESLRHAVIKTFFLQLLNFISHVLVVRCQYLNSLATKINT